MPIYEWNCPRCRIAREVIRPVEERERGPGPCPCGAKESEQERVEFSRTARPKVFGSKLFHRSEK